MPGEVGFSEKKMPTSPGIPSAQKKSKKGKRNAFLRLFFVNFIKDAEEKTLSKTLKRGLFKVFGKRFSAQLRIGFIFSLYL